MTDQATDDAPASTAKDAAVRKAEVPGEGSSVFAAVVTINRPAHELYAFWRDFTNLPKVMENIERIEPSGPDRTVWEVKAPAGRTVRWEATVTEDWPDALIGWRSVEGSDVRNSGRVEFTPVEGRGTVVRAVIAYDPPGGALAEFIAKLFQREPAIQARRDLRRFKQYMEAGEISTSARTRAAATDLPSAPAR